jgi:tryptophan synthase alpha subunit
LFLGFLVFLYEQKGYPSPQLTVPLMLAMEAGGVDVIELGIPFSEPSADGPVIRECHEVSSELILKSLSYKGKKKIKLVWELIYIND